MHKKHCRPRPMHCAKPMHCGTQTIVDPVINNVQHTFSEEVVEHIHPVHTTVVNHHKVKNVHMYPHTTSYANEESCEVMHTSPTHDAKPMPSPCAKPMPMPAPMPAPMPMPAPTQVSPAQQPPQMPKPQVQPKPSPQQKKWY